MRRGGEPPRERRSRDERGRSRRAASALLLTCLGLGTTTPGATTLGATTLGATTLCAATLCATTLCATTASAQPAPERQPVQVRLSGLFGDDLLREGAYAPLLVELTNVTRRELRGEVEVDIESWRGTPDRHHVRLDLPPGETRRVQLVARVREGGSSIAARYVAGRELGRTSIGVGYGGGEGIVVLSDPPRLRAALLDVSTESTDPYGSIQHVNVPVGVVPMDADTGDPLAPLRVHGWSVAALVVASAPLLERLSPQQKEALTQWVRTGGTLLVFPRTPEDLRAPLLRSLVGELRRVEGVAIQGHYAAVPESMRGVGLEGDARVRQEPFGASAPFGFGRVFVATFDGTQEHVTSPATRRTVVAALERYRRNGVDRPVFAYGGPEQDSSAPWGAYGGGYYDGSALRAALDPNESYRPALLLVALVLLLYVFVVGPINFRMIGKRNRPILALITTPIAAVVCLMVLLMVGYVGKGTTMRYRSVSLTEVMEGDSEGPRRRYMGLFLTRPTSFDLQMPANGALTPMNDSGRRPEVVHDDMPPTLAGLQGGLWETLFVRGESVADLGGAVRFDRGGSAITAVRNETAHDLLGAVILDGSGAVYEVGDVPAGGTPTPVATAAAYSVNTDGAMFWGRNDPELLRLASDMGLDRERGPRALQGLLQRTGGALTVALPTLIARVEAPPDEEVGGRFSQEMDLRIVRVVPWVDTAAVTVRSTPELDRALEEARAAAEAALDAAEVNP